MIVQLGGQTPLKLAAELQAAGVPILGTSPDSIDLAEDRERFAALVAKLGLKQPANGIARSRDEALLVASGSAIRCCCGRPTCSAGAAWRWSRGPQQLEHYIATAVAVSGISPVLIDRYLRDAIEVDVDAICDGTDVDRRRRAPAYRGSRGAFGRQRLRDPAVQPVAARSVQEIERQTRALALALKVKGLMNVQFAVKDERGLSDRGQSARQPHGAVRGQGDRAADGQDRGAGDGRRAAGRFRRDRARPRLCRGQGIGVPVRALPGDRSCAWTGNEEHRRSHGNR